MSIIYCHKHDQHWDSDREEDCPKCLDEYDESLPICNACEG